MTDFDIVIVGGGITGLWALSVLRQAGYNAVLFEKEALGSQQTLASQGIIHGGTKYTLHGRPGSLSRAMRHMPTRWQTHLQGNRLPDLSQATINASHQWMWPAGGIGSRISSFLAGRLMQDRVQPVQPIQLPSILQGRKIYQLNEPVLDVQSVLQVLASHNQGMLYRAEVIRAEQHAQHMTLQLRVATECHTVRTAAVIFSAGEGNAAIQQAHMQCRPLQMVMVKGELPSINGHIIATGTCPRLTITSHPVAPHTTVWYLGGQLAEHGAQQPADELITTARAELTTLLPAIDWQTRSWATLRINRAEGRQRGGRRPDQPVIQQHGRQLTVWPTKLAFAPLVADRLLEKISATGIHKQHKPPPQNAWPAATIAPYPWHTARWQQAKPYKPE